MAFPNRIYGSFGWELETTLTAKGGRMLGTIMELPDGRLYRWSFSDGAVTAGKLLQTKVPVAEDDMDVVLAAAAAVGDRSVSVTTAAAILANEYEDGFLYVNDGAGEGQRWLVGKHLAAGNAATLVLNLAGDQKVKTALATATSLLGFKWNRYKDVIVFPTTVTGVPVGVTPRDIADNTYFWAQVHGDSNVLIDGTVVLGKGVIPSDNVAGAVEVQVDAGGDDPVVGWVENPIAVDTDYGHIWLTIE